MTKTAPSHFREPGKRASGRHCSDNEDSSPQVRTLDQANFTVTGQIPTDARSRLRSHLPPHLGTDIEVVLSRPVRRYRRTALSKTLVWHSPCGVVKVDPEVVPVAGQQDEAAALQKQFPSYQIWVDETLGRSRYVARGRFLGLRPHTVITDDPAELRAALEPLAPAAT